MFSYTTHAYVYFEAQIFNGFKDMGTWQYNITGNFSRVFIHLCFFVVVVLIYMFLMTVIFPRILTLKTDWKYSLVYTTYANPFVYEGKYNYRRCQSHTLSPLPWHLSTWVNKCHSKHNTN